MDSSFIERGFLPEDDPLIEFGASSELAPLDVLGRDLPSLPALLPALHDLFAEDPDEEAEGDGEAGGDGMEGVDGGAGAGP